ncbi:MAG: radical SAM protein [Chitinivibrionales bacterium]|nr:radical SAM protein [Chitinivibrionales bacterium]
MKIMPKTIGKRLKAIPLFLPARRLARNLFFPFPAPHSRKAMALIEISSVCNAKCIFCNYRFGHRTKLLLPKEKFQRIAGACVAKGFQNLSLTSVGGENTLNPEFIDIIATAKAVGFKYIVTHTNGILLHRHNPGKLLTSGVDEIGISFPGFESGLFSTIFGTNGFDDFKKSIQGLLTEHARLNSSVRIIFDPRTTLTRKALLESEFCREFVQRFLNDRVIIQEPTQVFDSRSGAIKPHDLLPGMRLRHVTIKSLPFKKTFLCEKMFALSVLCNGNVRFCGCVFDASIDTENDPLYIDSLKNFKDFGDFLDHNIEKIHRIRTDFQNGILPSLCRKCTLYIPVSTKGIEL